MSRIAVLISGEYRKFDVTRPTMTFLNEENVDVYISTWDKTIFSNKRINLNVAEDVTEERIIKDLGRPATIKIDSHRLIEVDPKYNSKMIDRWLTGFNLIKSSNIKYDYVIVMRPDLIFDKNAPPSLEDRKSVV